MDTLAVVVVFGTLSLVGLTSFVGVYYNAVTYAVPPSAGTHARAWLGLAVAVLGSLTVYRHLRREPSRTPAALAMLACLAYVLGRAVAR